MAETGCAIETHPDVSLISTDASAVPFPYLRVSRADHDYADEVCFVRLQRLTFHGHELDLCIAPDPDVGYRASSPQTPLWFGYGDTPQNALDNYLGVAEAGYEFMRERGLQFSPAR